MRNVTTRKYMAESSLDLFSITAPGLESVTSGELSALGVASHSVTRGGVAWRGSLRELYNANLWSRTASRVVMRVGEFHASSFAELERRAKRMPWGRYVRRLDRVRFRVTCHKSALYHSDAVAQRFAESCSAVTGCSIVADVEGQEEIEPSRGEQLFVVRIEHDNVSVSADSSGTLLHKRGYRQATAKAPMRETIAAAMLLASEWRNGVPLIDPMCGSGTIPIEAALIARRIAPGLNRSFRFENWPKFDAAVWKTLREGAEAASLRRAASPIVAADRDAGGTAAAAANAERAGVLDDLEIETRSLSATRRVGTGDGWVLTNPPYGIRVGTDVRNLYASLGALMRGELSGWRLGILSASTEFEAQLDIPLRKRFATTNGGIPVEFMTTEGE